MIHDDLADLLRYPGDDYLPRLEAVRARCEEAETGKLLAAFGERLDGCSRTDLEERFCRTFDLNPVCALEVGWHLFGEDYKRGALLVRVRQDLAEVGIEEREELADHLIHILPLLGRLEPERADALAKVAVLPAIGKMRESLVQQDNEYRYLLAAVERALRVHHGVPEEVVV